MARRPRKCRDKKRTRDKATGMAAAGNEPRPGQRRQQGAQGDTDPLKKYAWSAPALRDLPEASLLTSAAPPPQLLRGVGDGLSEPLAFRS